MVERGLADTAGQACGSAGPSSSDAGLTRVGASSGKAASASRSPADGASTSGPRVGMRWLTSGTSSSATGVARSPSAPHASSMISSSSLPWAGVPAGGGVESGRADTMAARSELPPVPNPGSDGRSPLAAGAGRLQAQRIQSPTRPGLVGSCCWARNAARARPMSPALGQRSSGSLARARRIRASSSGRTAGLNADGGATSPRWTWSRVWYSFFCANSGRAVISSCATTPSENTSDRRSSGLPAIDSGAMYASLPLTRPVCVRRCADWARAMPKSITLSTPAPLTMRFDGEMSRCTSSSGWPSASQHWWAYSSAAQAWLSSDSDTGSGGGPVTRRAWRRICRRSLPSMYSIEMK